MGKQTERTSIKVAQERAVLAAVHLPESRIDHRDPLGELQALAESAGAVIVGELTQRRERPEAGTFIGSGKLNELKAICDATEATLVIFDNDLSPAQIGNIEEIVGRKVVDRSELILDIFASRATTREAKLQVELAQLEYTYPRLRAMWSHLERIVGAGGIGGIGTRGPGEQQIEIDRRLVQQRRDRLKRELADIQGRKSREVKARKLDHFTVGLVGYTNAGKSTLFNAVTEGGAYADDRLFATLVTRTREWAVGGGESVMLSDTVGFVRDLPHNLVASFKATLEEATHADLLLVVLDVADPAAELQYETVMRTLDDLFDAMPEAKDAEETGWTPPERLLVLNKVDLLRDNAELLVWTQQHPGSIAINAKDPDHPGHERLRERVRAAATGPIRERTLRLSLKDARSISLLERRAEVLDRQYENGEALLTVRIGDRQLERLRSAGVRAE
ncbi:MAG: GTPase HflX [Phycisphaerales bacterium]